MNELQALLADIEKKKAEVQAAHDRLVQFKADLDEGFRKLQYLRLRVLRLADSGEVTPVVRKMIEDAVRD